MAVILSTILYSLTTFALYILISFYLIHKYYFICKYWSRCSFILFAFNSTLPGVEVVNPSSNSYLPFVFALYTFVLHFSFKLFLTKLYNIRLILAGFNSFTFIMKMIYLICPDLMCHFFLNLFLHFSSFPCAHFPFSLFNLVK